MYASNIDTEYHIKLSKGDGAKYAIVCGAPERVADIAKCFDNPKFVAQNREFLSYSGFYKNEKILVTSTGIGGPSAAIAVEELSHIGVDTIIRVGTCGGIQLDITPGELIIASGAFRMDGTTREYAPIEFPAIANYEVTTALINASKSLQFKYHVGIVQSKDSFYGQHNPNSTAIPKYLLKKWEALERCNVLGSEMECSTLFVVSSIRKIRAGAVLQTIWNQERDAAGIKDEYEWDTKNAVVTAANALKDLITSDMEKN